MTHKKAGDNWLQSIMDW